MYFELTKIRNISLINEDKKYIINEYEKYIFEIYYFMNFKIYLLESLSHENMFLSVIKIKIYFCN